MVRHANNRNIWLNLRDSFPHPYTKADALEFVERQVSEAEAHIFAIEVDGEAVGAIGLARQEDVLCQSAEIGYWLGESYWGRGIMTDAVRTVTAYGLREMGFVRIFAHVFEWNLGSMRVLEKAGYVMEGRHRKAVTKAGQTLDEFTYAIVRKDESDLAIN